MLLKTTVRVLDECSTFLSYGGVLKVVRTDDTVLPWNNANAGVGIASTTRLKINNYDDYQVGFHKESEHSFTYAAEEPWNLG